MAAAKKNNNDFESRFFDLLEGTIQGIDKKVDEHGKEHKGYESRLRRVEAKVFPRPAVSNKKDLPPFWRDPAIIRLFTIVALIVLVTVVFITKVDISKLMP